MPAQSVITFPSGGMQLPGPGHYEISGLAWSGRGRVARVEVSTDGGRRWALAALQEPVLPVCHTRFRHPWRWDGGPAVLQSRCRDETGDAQPQRGPARNRIHSWQVAAGRQRRQSPRLSGRAQKRGAASGSSARVT